MKAVKLILFSFLLTTIFFIENSFSQLSCYHIVIDPGHGGPGTGGTCANGVFERVLVLEISLKLRTILLNRGATVAMTRTTDVSVSLTARKNFINNENPDAAISIHLNGFNGIVQGTITFWRNGSLSTTFANNVQSRLVAAIGYNDRGISIGNFTVLYTNASIPTILTESLFEDEPNGCAYINLSSNQTIVATAHADGIQDYLPTCGVPSPPANDDCSSATALTSNTSCINTQGNVNWAIASGLAKPSCDGFASPALLDVWYQFTASATSHTITVSSSASFDAVVALYTSCSGGEIGCADAGGLGITETINATSLTVGVTYYIRVYDYGSITPTTTTFDICVTHAVCTPPSAPPNPTSNSPQCSNVTITRSGTPPGGETWYWQGTSCGTSTVLGSGTTYNAASSGTYYIRAYNTSGNCWSSGCGSVSVTVSGTVTPLVSISPSPSTTICSGQTVSFTATPTNGGGSPTYQWYLNGSPTGTVPAYTTPALTSNASVYCIMTSNANCASPSTATSTTTTITVDPVTVGGTVSGSATVCSGANSGNLTLSGHTGNILRWEYSTDGGVTWTNITNTTTTQNYSNLTTTTMYRAVVKSGVCPSANSSPATITVDPVTVGGIVLSNATVCSGSNSGTLTLSGHVGSVLRWQFSTDSGATWTNIFNTTTTLTYNNLITTIPNQQTTILYRAVVKSGVCPPENSSPATITIDPVTIGGTVAFDATVCKNSNSGTLALTGQVGIVLSWEYSIDGGVTWTNIANTTTTQSYSNLTTTTMYHAVVKSGVCPVENSFAATIITLDTMTVAGTVFGSPTVCSGANIGTLTLTSQVGNVLNWEYSIDGGITWMSIPNTTALQSYNNLTTTTMYRAVVQSGICPTENSAAATITVDPVTIGGTISGSATVCSGSNSGTLILNGQTGNVLRWEFSSDGGVTWVNIANTTTTQTYSNLTATTMYRAVVKSGVCPPDNSATATIAVDPVSVGGTIPNNTVCSGANNGTLTLTGYVGNILQWEFLTDGEMTWTTIANTTPVQDYTNISTVTRYRAIVQSGVCPADTSSIAVIFLFPLTVADAGVDTTISLGYSVTLNGTGGEIYSWSPETSLNDPNISNPIATPLETITYTLTVTDENECEGTDKVTITVLVDYNFIISNLITPNGDGFNDTWHIDNIENYPDCEVSIYNRYGNLLFNSSPYVKEWEGSYKGSQLPDGTYYYVLTCLGTNKVFKGGITILRQN